MTTPCEEKGIKVGDKVVFKAPDPRGDSFPDGAELTLLSDDGSENPPWEGPALDGDSVHFASLECVSPAA